MKGIALRIGEGLVEGARVKRGDFIVEIEPTAANLIEQLKASLQDLDAKLSTANIKAEVYGQNVRDFEAAKKAAVTAADELVAAAEAKWDAKQQLVPAYEAKELQAKLNYQRQYGLFEKGVRSEKEIEQFRKDWDVAQAELESILLDVTEARAQWDAKRSERIQKEREAQTKVDYSRAMQQDALGQAATVQKEKRELEVKLSELDRLVIRARAMAPCFG